MKKSELKQIIKKIVNETNDNVGIVNISQSFSNKIDTKRVEQDGYKI